MQEIKNLIENTWLHRDQLSEKPVTDAIEFVIEELDGK